MPDLLSDHTGESYKGALHFAAALLCGTFAAYNAGAYRVRPDKRLAFNALLYAVATAWEGAQTYRHWREVGK